jgi:hypothetical protein
VAQRRRCGHGETSRWRSVVARPTAATNRLAPASGEKEEAAVDVAPRKKDSKAPHRWLCGGARGVAMLDGEQRRLRLHSTSVCGDLRGRDDELVGRQCSQAEEGGGGFGGAAGLDPATRRGGSGKPAVAHLPGDGGGGALARTDSGELTTAHAGWASLDRHWHLAPAMQR